MQLKEQVTEWFEYLGDEDLLSDKGYECQLLKCTDCGALFSEKACGNRTVFIWSGFHPTDGNVKIIKEELVSISERKAIKCKCPSRLDRIITVHELKNALDDLIEEKEEA